MQQDYFILADVTPKEVLAGDSVEIAVRLVAGPAFRAAGSRLVLDLPAYLGYSRPTCLHQEIGGFTEVFCSNPDLRYTKRVWDIELCDYPTEKKSSFKGMAQRLFVLDFQAGEARAGDEILIKWGYLCHGFSCGTKVTTLVLEREFFNTIHIRYFQDGTRGLPDYGRSFEGHDRPVPEVEIPVRFRILPREPERLRLIRRENRTSLLVLDRFSNISPVEDLAEVINEKGPARVNAFGVFELKHPGAGITSKALPLTESPSMAEVYEGRNVYFGDLHVHSSFSIDCIEREKQEMTPDRTFAFARDVACLDFLAVTDHHQPWRDGRHRLGRENWRLVNDAAGEYTADGEFAAFPGFEFECERGDTAVVVNEELTYDEISAPELKGIRDIWERFKGRALITIPHFHHVGQLELGQWYECPYPGMEPSLEIFSCHGSYENDRVLERHIAEIKKFRADRHGKYFLCNGYHYGFTCNSDGHKGNAGYNGLTAVYAKELTRDTIFDALKRRNVYGTTNARIRLLFTINGHLMGSILPATARKLLHISAAGEAPIKAVDVFRNGELFKRFRPDKLEFAVDLAIGEEGPSNWYVRVTQADNHIAYGSPIWVI